MGDASPTGVPTALLTERLNDLAGPLPADVRWTPLAGGFSRDTYRVDVPAHGGAPERIWAVSVLKPLHQMSTARLGLSAVEQCELLRLLSNLGLPVPRPVCACDQLLDEGGALLVTEFVTGAVAPREVLRTAGSPAARDELSAALATTLARIHDCDLDGLARRDLPPGELAAAWVNTARGLAGAVAWLTAEPRGQFSALLDAVSARPVPPIDRPVLLHGDYRVGNVVCAGTAVRAVLDWELAHWGDPAEDVAWAALRSWRYREGAVGGLVAEPVWVAQYLGAAGRGLDPAALRYWEAIGCVKMTVLAAEAAAQPGASPGDRPWIARMVSGLIRRLADLTAHGSPAPSHY